MLRTVTAIERDGLDVRVLVLNFDVPSKEFDLMAAVKAAALEYCQTEDGKKTYNYNCRCFNWADFEMNVPNEICAKHGFTVLESPVSDLVVDWDEQLVDEAEVYPEEKEDLGTAEGAPAHIEDATYVSVWDGGYAVETVCKVNRQTGEVFDVEVSDVDTDGLNVLDEEYVRFADGTRRSVVDGYLDERWPLRNYDDAVQHLCDVLNQSDYELDLDDNWEPIKADEFVPIFKSGNYFGIYCWHNDENQYYLVDRNNGEHKVVLGDSFEFVGQNTLDCLKGEKVLHVANREWLKYLIDFSLENVKDVVPESKLGGLAVLESAWRDECKKQGGYVMGTPLAERIKMATEKAEGALGNSMDVADVELDKD